jgi:hypothetical protein
MFTDLPAAALGLTWCLLRWSVEPLAHWQRSTIVAGDKRLESQFGGQRATVVVGRSALGKAEILCSIRALPVLTRVG